MVLGGLAYQRTDGTCRTVEGLWDVWPMVCSVLEASTGCQTWLQDLQWLALLAACCWNACNRFACCIGMGLLLAADRLCRQRLAHQRSSLCLTCSPKLLVRSAQRSEARHAGECCSRLKTSASFSSSSSSPWVSPSCQWLTYKVRFFTPFFLQLYANLKTLPLSSTTTSLYPLQYLNPSLRRPAWRDFETSPPGLILLLSGPDGRAGFILPDTCTKPGKLLKQHASKPCATLTTVGSNCSAHVHMYSCMTQSNAEQHGRVLTGYPYVSMDVSATIASELYPSGHLAAIAVRLLKA